ncbi:hypothetical protein F5141DRAFT_1069756 [Pisolithus sp. B1]|nr:hypothetical protein F5141DRAFT_1069756 [Pisolithus sp. B1]
MELLSWLDIPALQHTATNQLVEDFFHMARVKLSAQENDQVSLELVCAVHDKRPLVVGGQQRERLSSVSRGILLFFTGEDGAGGTNEMSMLGKMFLAHLSHNIAIGKMMEGSPACCDSFGGISVIMCGDFHAPELLAEDDW